MGSNRATSQSAFAHRFQLTPSVPGRHSAKCPRWTGGRTTQFQQTFLRRGVNHYSLIQPTRRQPNSPRASAALSGHASAVKAHGKQRDRGGATYSAMVNRSRQNKKAKGHSGELEAGANFTKVVSQSSSSRLVKRDRSGSSESAAAH